MGTGATRTRTRPSSDRLFATERHLQADLLLRGDDGKGAGRRLAAMNLVEAGLKAPVAYLGHSDSDTVVVEYDEFAEERLRASIATAEEAVDWLVDTLVDATRREECA